ncbi:MAG: TIGR03960 family B12-binding radical SAM protein [Lachnospiraceae bacterium]|nr:TIGR03960 family B12-binding radical SAM protein [Lachnospiraceae bacterium]MDY5742513.1 TIGR03960 family B12-binding radical SAM protein [Lachnospiraceae bacterium]
MRKLALADEILRRVEKPARYIGGEVGTYNKELTADDLRFVFCFPDVYEIGMSHLGMQILYHQFNEMPNVICERVYAPWIDLEKQLRKNNQLLFSLESQQPVKTADFLGFTLQYEMCYTNILQVLELSGIPLLAEQRSEDAPIIIGGGPCAYNPEPLADFFDMFYIGEGEVVYEQLFDLYRQYRRQKKNRSDFLRDAAQIPGIYVPGLYQAQYGEDGIYLGLQPLIESAPLSVKRQVVSDMKTAYYPNQLIVPFLRATQDRVVMEIQRGCIRGCRFCQAGMVYRPTRERDVEFLYEQAIKLLKQSGHEEISLSSLSSSDYSELQPLIYRLIEYCNKHHINISLPSLRIDAFAVDVMQKVQDVNKTSITFAPEAGSQRLRDVINKGLTEDDILHGAALAFAGGWTNVKLYFMLGLPGETPEDVREIARLADKIARIYYEIPKSERHGKCNITISTSFFVPKPFTPFQWSDMDSAEAYLEKVAILRDELRQMLNRKSIRYNWHESDLSVLEGALARGDRRMAAVILAAYQNGARFDSWSDQFCYEHWQSAFSRFGIDPDSTRKGTGQPDAPLPWDILDVGVSKRFLYRDFVRSQRAELTPNCKQACSGCGAAEFGGGICFEN